MRRNINREILRKYFNVYLLNCKKLKLEDDINIVEKFKNICEKIEGNEMNIEKLLNIDNEKIAKMLDMIVSGKNLNFQENKNEKKDDDYSVSKVSSDAKIPPPQVI